MAAERFEIRIPAFKLLIAMMVIIIPICFIGLLAITRADTTLEQTAGTDFKTLAQIKAAQVANFIHERVAEVRNLSIGLAVANAVAAANQKYQGRSDAEILAAAANTTKIWNTPAADPLVTEILSTPASRLLRKHQQYDPSFLRITVTDIRGAVVAATHKPVVYSQADDEHWRNIYADGRGAVNVTDVLYDDVTKSNYVGIGMPILEEGSSRLIGTIDVLMEVSAIFPLLRDVQLGRTGRLMLVQDDGTVVAAPGVSTAAKMKAEEYAAIRDALGTVSGRQTGYIVASFRDSRQLSASPIRASKTITRNWVGWCWRRRILGKRWLPSARSTGCWRSCRCWASWALCFSACMSFCTASRVTRILRELWHHLRPRALPRNPGFATRGLPGFSREGMEPFKAPMSAVPKVVFAPTQLPS